jgi:thymidylate kinase
VIKKIVLTGGPCAGKTSAIKVMQETAEKYKFRHIVVPEIARIFITAGMEVRTLTGAAHKRMQMMIMLTQIQMEKSAQKYLETFNSEDGVIICDRGCCDNGAYIDRYDYRDILLQCLGCSVHETLERYDAVFHMQSAAVGATEHYKTDAVRTDTIEQAAKLEFLTQMQWDAHKHFNFIPNPHNGGFEAKLQILRELFTDELRRK